MTCVTKTMCLDPGRVGNRIGKFHHIQSSFPDLIQSQHWGVTDSIWRNYLKYFPKHIYNCNTNQTFLELLNRYFWFQRIPDDVAAADDLKKSSLQHSSSTHRPAWAQGFNGFEKTIELIVLHKSFLFCDTAKVKLTSGLSQAKSWLPASRPARQMWHNSFKLFSCCWLWTCSFWPR